MGQLTHRLPSVGAIVTGAVLVFLYLPLVIVVLFAFHRAASLSLPFQGFSLRWFRDIANTQPFLDSVKYDLKIAGTVVAVLLLTGLPAAYALARANSRLANLITAFVLLPIALPGIFIGPSMLLFLHSLGINNSFKTVVAGQVILIGPLMIVLLRGAIERLDPAVEEVARDLGATGLTVFFRTVLPVIWPIVVAAACLVFVISFDEFPVTFFLIGPQSTVPLYIYGQMLLTVDPSVNAVAAALLLSAFGLMFLGGAAYFVRRQLAADRTAHG